MGGVNGPRNGTNLFVFPAENNGGGQGGFLDLIGNGDGVEQVSRALLRFLLSDEVVGGLVILLRNVRTELVRYPIERIVERDSKRPAVSVNYSNEVLFTYPLRGTHCT